MTTNILKTTLFLLCMGSFTNIDAQGLYNLATLDDESDESQIWSSDYNEFTDKIEDGIEWANNTLGGTLGFGWNSNDGNSDISYCGGVEYLHRITGQRQNPNGAGYLGAFATYHASNSDNFDQSYFRAGAKYSYFDPISPFNKVQLIYGANAYYETGRQEVSNFKDDVTGYGANLYTGVNVRLCERASVGLEIPIASFVSRNFESNGSEVRRDDFGVGLNKDNTVSATFRWHLGNAIKYGGIDTDGDGLYDRDDACPEEAGLEAFNGCPDTDYDGIPDKDDDCPNTAGSKENNGCPDTNDN